MGFTLIRKIKYSRQMKTLCVLFLSIALSSFISCAQKNSDCNGLPESFTSFQNAVEQVQNSKFLLQEVVDNPRSSWIKGLSYFSCDGQNGFLLMKTSKKTYLHQKVPIDIWRELCASPSLGSYYDKNIKHHFRLQIKTHE
jgi:hypothetical protein